MTRTHSCGGTFQRTDIAGSFDPKRRRMMYTDLDPKAAHWKCSRCGATRTQRKRQPKEKVNG